MRYSVTLERGTDSGYMAWVHELPGCFARGATREEVESKIRPAIAEFLSWTGSGGQGADAVEFSIVAEVGSVTEARNADSEVLLEPDRAALTPQDWATIERWLRLSRREVLRALRMTGEADMDRKPEGSPRSIRGHFVHVGFVEFMYMAWTFDLHSKEGIAAFLRWTRRLATARMRTLARSYQSAVTQADWSGAPRPEPWTPRKAARRLLWHERLHLRAIRRLLARSTKA